MALASAKQAGKQWQQLYNLKQHKNFQVKLVDVTD